MNLRVLLGSVIIVGAVLIYGKYFYCDKEVEAEQVENYKLHGLPGFDLPLKPNDWDVYRRRSVITGKPVPGGIWKAFKELQLTGKLSISNLRKNRTDGIGWEPVNDFFASLSITRLTYDPNDPTHLYFCTGEGWGNADAVRGAGVWHSTDAGMTWNQIPSTDSFIFYQCQDMVIHPSTGDIYVATRQAGLQRSTDGGTTWEKVLGAGIAGGANNSICDIELTASGSIFATNGIFEGGGIFFSNSGDSGTWVKQTNGFPTSGIYRVEIATAPSNDSIAYAIPIKTNYRIEGVYVTLDKGDRWVKVNSPGGDDRLAASQGWYDLTLAVDPNNSSVIAAGGLNLWRSQDGGINWQQVTQGSVDTLLVKYVHVDQHEIYFQSSDTIFFGNDGGLWKCDNFQADIPNIYDINYGYNVTQFYAGDIHPTDPTYLIGGTQDNGSYKSMDAGFAPFQRISGADGAWCFFNYDNPDILYTTTQYKRMYRFKKGGLYESYDNLTPRNSIIENGDVQFINPFVMDNNDPDRLFLATKIGVWKLENASTASRDDWTKITKNAGTLTAISSSTNPPNHLFLGKRSGSAAIFRVDNSDFVTDPYTPIEIDPLNQLPDVFGLEYECSSIYVNPNDANHLIVTYVNYGALSVWECKNALDTVPTWENIEGDLVDVPVNWAVLHPEDSTVCYIGTDIGVFRTENIQGDSTEWIPTMTGMAAVRTDMLRISKDKKTIMAATHGRGMFTASLESGGFDLTWEERGPINYGGRTRTIMLDPNDPTKQRLYAGSVSGGLWFTESLTSLKVRETVSTNLSIQAAPNPFGREGVTFRTKENLKDAFIEVYNINGALIDRQLLGAETTFKWIPPAGTNAGIYLVSIRMGDRKYFSKVVYTGK